MLFLCLKIEFLSHYIHRILLKGDKMISNFNEEAQEILNKAKQEMLDLKLLLPFTDKNGEFVDTQREVKYFALGYREKLTKKSMETNRKIEKNWRNWSCC